MSELSNLGLFHLTGSGLLFFLTFFVFREWGWRVQMQSEEQEMGMSHHPWSGQEALEIVEVIQETHDIKTFRFKRKEGDLFPHFQAGQFFTFQIGDENNKVMRSYSISSSEINRQVISVSIKKLPDGHGSTWFHQLQVGDQVLAHTPNGQFVLPKVLPRAFVFIAGGIGITPFLSMIKTQVDKGESTPIYLFYGMRTTKDLAFHKVLENLSQSHDFFHYFPILSEQDSQWSGEQGYVSFEMIKERVTPISENYYFFCGPPIMYDNITPKLQQAGVDPSHIHSEKFASPVSLDESQIPERQVKVNYQGHNLDYQGKSTILEFLEDQGQDINYSCRVGVCGVCKCQLKKGEVDQFSDAGLSTEDKAQGYILTCVSRPKTDVELG